MRLMHTAMKRSVAIFSLFFASSFADAEILGPNTPWYVNHGTDQCNLIRSFGEEPNAYQLQLDRFGTARTVSFNVIGNFRRAIGMISAEVRSSPSGVEFEKSAVISDLSGRSERMLQLFLVRLDDLSGLRDSQILEIEPRSSTTVQFRLEGIEAALASLDDCNNELLAEWNVDMGDAAVFPEPANNPARWVTYADYPADAQRAGIEGRATFRLDITTEGEVSNCEIVHSSGSTSLDETTCERLEERARFTPAYDSNGQPVPSHFVSAVSFSIPR